MKVIIELEISDEGTSELNITELRAEIHQDCNAALNLVPISNALSNAYVLEVHIENNN
jgi:hypothetical protein